MARTVARSSRLAAGILLLTAAVLVLPSIAAVMGSLGGKALDFSGRSLEMRERVALAGLPLANIVLFVVTRMVWRGNRTGHRAGMVIGVVAGIWMASQINLSALVLGGPPAGPSIDLRPVLGLGVVALLEILLWLGHRAARSRATPST